ncbi:MAG: superoxide dismutase family protein [Candidatus Omnitrophica bacterium]|nr:superoxide dismutase family protein [Candidatus Omnitrophota bacterium]
MKKILITVGLVCLSVTVWAACGVVTDCIDRNSVRHVILKGTASDSEISGTVNLIEENGGIAVEARVQNVPPGKHGFHIHENGSCAEMGKAAGGHFNPDKVEHGFMPQMGSMHAHAGDMGNIEVGKDGTGTLKIFMKGLTLKEGKYAVAGKSIILHEKEDDFSQPTGNAGGRIGCGVIVAN